MVQTLHVIMLRGLISLQRCYLPLPMERLFTFADGNVFTGRSLWGFGEEVMNSVKKAISLMPKLAPQICSINKNFAVISFSSGKTEENMFPMIDNGMYNMEVLPIALIQFFYL